MILYAGGPLAAPSPAFRDNGQCSRLTISTEDRVMAANRIFSTLALAYFDPATAATQVG